MSKDFESGLPKEFLQGKIIGIHSLIKRQAKAIKQIGEELEEIKAKGLDSEEDLKEASKLLRDFHICVENALIFIANSFDGGIPTEDAHKSLIKQMSSQFGKERPAVIDETLAGNLEEYLNFRFDFEKSQETAEDKDRVNLLIEKFEEVSVSVENQILNFNEELKDFHGLEKEEGND